MLELINTSNVVHGGGLGDIASLLPDDNGQLHLMIERFQWVRDLDGPSILEIGGGGLQEQHRLLKTSKQTHMRSIDGKQKEKSMNPRYVTRI